MERFIVFIINFTGRITALHCKCGYTRGEAGRRHLAVNSLATAAVIVQETLQADSSLDQIQQVSEADAEVSFLPSSCYLSWVRGSEVTASCPCRSACCILTGVSCAAGYEALNYTQIQKKCHICQQHFNASQFVMEEINRSYCTWTLRYVLILHVASSPSHAYLWGVSTYLPFLFSVYLTWIVHGQTRWIPQLTSTMGQTRREACWLFTKEHLIRQITTNMQLATKPGDLKLLYCDKATELLRGDVVQLCSSCQM